MFYNSAYIFNRVVKLHHVSEFPMGCFKCKSRDFSIFFPTSESVTGSLFSISKCWKVSLEKRLFSSIPQGFYPIFIDDNELCCRKGVIIFNNKFCPELQLLFCISRCHEANLDLQKLFWFFLPQFRIFWTYEQITYAQNILKFRIVQI